MAAAAAPMAGLESRNSVDFGQTGKKASPVEALGWADIAAGQWRGRKPPKQPPAAGPPPLAAAAAVGRLPERDAGFRCGPAAVRAGTVRAAGGRPRPSRWQPETAVGWLCGCRQSGRSWLCAGSRSSGGGGGAGAGGRPGAAEQQRRRLQGRGGGPDGVFGPVAARGGVARRWAGAATVAERLAPPSVGYSFKLN